MPRRKLTDLFVERLKPPAAGQVDYFDAAFPALALRVTANGVKSWSLFYRMHGRLRRLTLGRYPAIKPAQARREAQAALERVRLGADPAAGMLKNDELQRGAPVKSRFHRRQLCLGRGHHQPHGGRSLRASDRVLVL